MRSPQTLTQRIVPALAVTVVATLVLGAVVVTADVAVEDDPRLPETFSVASPRLGDAWRYNLTLHGGWTFGADDQVPVNESLPFGTLQWVGTGQVRGGDGRMHDANRLVGETLHYSPGWLDLDGEDYYAGYEDYGYETEDTYWGESSFGAWVLAGARTVVSEGGVHAENDTYTDYGLGGGTGIGASKTSMFEAVGGFSFPTGKVPCLAANALQGTNATLDAPVQVFDACAIGGDLLALPKGLLFTAKAVETVGGIETVRFEGRLNGTYQAWFSPSVPYPVRLAFSLPSLREAVLEDGDRDLPRERSGVLTLSGYVPGTEPLDQADDPADPAPAPDFVLAPRILSGPDDSGIDHPFPLSDALAAAAASETWRDYRTYMLSHPDAYVAAAEYDEGTQQGYERTWRIGLTDGQETFSFAVSNGTMDPNLPMLLRGQAPPMLSFQSGWGPYGDWESAPYPSRAPALLPTVASIAERWAAFDGSGLPLNAYDFQIRCRDPGDDPCQAPEVTIRAGHVRREWNQATRYPAPLYGSEQTAYIERFVVFDLEGTASRMEVRDHRTSTEPIASSPLPNPPGAQPDPGYTRLEASAVSGIPAESWVPAPQEAAGIGFLGLVVGFLYWIWPKLGLVGLFSRLDRGELLDHPARQKLVQIVESQPGIHFHDLAQKADLANGTAVHHLRKLTDSGHLSLRRSGRYTCYFPGGRVDPHAAAAAPLLKSDGARLVLDHVRARPGMSNLELAQATGLQPSTVNYHVQRLSQAGLVSALRDGRHVRLHPGLRSGVVGDAAA